MSTRGCIGFRTTKDYKTTDNVFVMYNGSDSYYSILGKNMLNIYINHDNKYFLNIFKNIVWTEKDTFGEFNREYEFLDLLETGKCDAVQDDNGKYKFFENKYYMTDGLFMEYCYIYNLKTDKLEVYRGNFNGPQYEGQQGYKDKHFIHKVFEISRTSDFEKIKTLFDNYYDIEKYYSIKDIKTRYVEQRFLKDDLDINDIKDIANKGLYLYSDYIIEKPFLDNYTIKIKIIEYSIGNNINYKFNIEYPYKVKKVFVIYEETKEQRKFLKEAKTLKEAKKIIKEYIYDDLDKKEIEYIR